MTPRTWRSILFAFHVDKSSQTQRFRSQVLHQQCPKLSRAVLGAPDVHFTQTQSITTQISTFQIQWSSYSYSRRSTLWKNKGPTSFQLIQLKRTQGGSKCNPVSPLADKGSFYPIFNIPELTMPLVFISTALTWVLIETYYLAFC